MSKKIILSIVVAVVVIYIVAFMAYRYSASNQLQQEVIQQEQQGQNQSEEKGAQLEGIQVETESGGQAQLLVCIDKCGDGICQSKTEECSGLNCVCEETDQLCPQDCAQ